MNIKDEIYGEFEIDVVLEELINCKAVQRLKKVHQGGAVYLMDSKLNGTRYEHSVGVMLLIRQLGGSVEEQIAGLLHDVSHTAFSHVIDYVVENKEEDYHEDIYNQVIDNSRIPEILQKHGYNEKALLHDIDQWTLLEQPLPNLCADRIDYTLRDLRKCGTISLEEIHLFLKELMVVNGRIGLSTIESAEWFVETYYKEVIDFFSNPLSIYSNAMLAKAIKVAVEKAVITLDTLLETDDVVWSLLENCKDEEVLALVSKLQQNVQLEKNNEDYDVYLKNKPRLIDPSVYVESKFVRASSISERIKKMNEVAKCKMMEPTYVKVSC